MYGACEWKLEIKDKCTRFFLELCDCFDRNHCECQLICDEISANRQQKTRSEEFKAAKIRGSGTYMAIHAQLLNNFRFGILRERGEYYMLDFHVAWVEQAGVLERFDTEFKALTDKNEKKMLALFTVVMVGLRRLRNEKLEQYDGAVKSGNKKEIWETGIYIDGFNEMEQAMIITGKKYGTGGFLYE